MDVPCLSGCADIRVEAVDRGLVFVPTGDGTFAWDPNARGTRERTQLWDGRAPRRRRANRHVLWFAEPPTPAPDSPVADWDFKRGQIAELSHDGRHALYWSSTLKLTAHHPGLAAGAA